jgi:chorismate synthase
MNSGGDHDTALAAAREALSPDRFGFRAHLHGWQRDFPVLGQVAFATLAWPHNQVHSYDHGPSELVNTNALALLVTLQQRVWGFPPEETVPVNVLSILEDTGGGIIVAYEPEKGFNADGWLGFAIGMGTRSGELYSHMLGVREDVRGTGSLGWCLKVLQAYLAVESGHHAMTWTFDPLRGANARLNIEKLGASMVNLTIDKYGVMRSSLYGEVPTDRFTAYWKLLDPAMHERLHLVRDGHYRQRSDEEIDAVPEATAETLHELVDLQPAAVRYQIPGNIDELMRHDPAAAVHWRQEMRQILGEFMTVRTAHLPPDAMQEGPIGVSMHVEPGNYVATGFASRIDDETNERQSYYILTKGSQP